MRLPQRAGPNADHWAWASGSRLQVMPIDRAALVAGSIRLALSVSFLVDPLRANRLWGEPDDPGTLARLLLRSMGCRRRRYRRGLGISLGAVMARR